MVILRFVLVLLFGIQLQSSGSLGEQSYFQTQQWISNKESFSEEKMTDSCKTAYESVKDLEVFTPGLCTGNDVNAKLLARWYCLSMVVSDACKLNVVECVLRDDIVEEGSYPNFGCYADYTSPCNHGNQVVQQESWKDVEQSFSQKCLDKSQIPINGGSVYLEAYFNTFEYFEREHRYFTEETRSTECKSLLPDDETIEFIGSFCQGERPSAEVAKLFCKDHCVNQCANVEKIGCASNDQELTNLTKKADIMITCHCSGNECPSTFCTKTWEDVEKFYMRKCAVMTLEKCNEYVSGHVMFHNGACYQIFGDKLTLDDALIYCNNQNQVHDGKLATIQEQKLIDKLKAIIDPVKEDVGNSLWTGLRQVGLDWRWLDNKGSYLGDKAQCTSIFWWSDDQCEAKPTTATDSCAVLGLKENQLLYETASCEQELPYVCQFGPDTELPYTKFETSVNQGKCVDTGVYAPITISIGASVPECQKLCSDNNQCRTVSQMTITQNGVTTTVCHIFERYVIDMWPLMKGECELYEKHYGVEFVPAPARDQWMKDILKKHNDLRSVVAKGENPLISSRAAYMTIIVWSLELQMQAQKYSESCGFKYDVNRPADEGENYLETAADENHNYADDIETKWFTEQLQAAAEKNYTYTSYKSSEDTDFLTQLIWHTSIKIGCGATTCSATNEDGTKTDKDFVVCRYSSRGNIENEPVFIDGATCSKCKGQCSDSDGLCLLGSIFTE